MIDECSILFDPVMASTLQAGGRLNIKSSYLTSKAIPVLKIRRPRDRLIFNLWIRIPEKDGLYIETGPCWRLWSNIFYDCSWNYRRPYAITFANWNCKRTLDSPYITIVYGTIVHSAQQLQWWNLGQISTHDRYPTLRLYRRGMWCLSWVIRNKMTTIYRESTVLEAMQLPHICHAIYWIWFREDVV